MKKHRVVITGLGVTAPNAIGTEDFEKALREGKSGIQHWEESAELNFRCQLGGAPPITQEYLDEHLPIFHAQKIQNKGILYGCLAGFEAWKDAGFEMNPEHRVKDAGLVFGSGALAMDDYTGRIYIEINGGNNRKLGSRIIPQCMNSGAAAYVNQVLGLGSANLSNSSACITGSEALLMGYERVAAGLSKVMLCGSTEGIGRYIWGSFDGMRVLVGDSNDNPHFGSRPMSDSSMGFVPSGGAGALVIETLESAQERGAKIYAELLGGAQNCGGLRDGGSMTAPNSEALVECIEDAVESSGIDPDQIDLISGHLTSTYADPVEVANWKKGLKRTSENFPLINTPKSMIGHCIAGAGSIESVACALQIDKGFVHKNLNLTEETVHPKIKEEIPTSCIPLETIEKEVKTVIKSNFGFGDLNCVLVFRKFEN